MTVSALLGRIFAGSEQINVEEMRRRAVIAQFPADVVAAIGDLPRGLYGLAAAEALLVRGPGVDPATLSEDDLVREMESLGHTRAQTVRHGSWSALARHTTRSHELENEYLRRHPDREISPRRTRAGARATAVKTTVKNATTIKNTVKNAVENATPVKDATAAVKNAAAVKNRGAARAPR